MNTITAATCCCDQPEPGPCDPPTTGSAIQLTWQEQQAIRRQQKTEQCGDCTPCTETPCDEPDISPSPFFGCTFDLTVTPGSPCDVVNVDYDQNMSQAMPQPWTAILPWVSSGESTGTRRWYTPDGLLTDFSAFGGQRVDTYGGLVAGIRETPVGTIPAQGCRVRTTDPACLINLTATFRNWPYYTTGPTVYRIRRGTSTSPARTWEVVGRAFRIKNSSGTVLWSTTLIGKTLAQVKDEANAQTAARVTMTWATVPDPNAFSQGLSAETYFADQAYTVTNIPTSTAAPSDIRLFSLTNQQPLPDPQPGQCSNAFITIGWNTPVGSGVLYDTMNAAYHYGRGACSRALFNEMCAGVGFAGEANFYDPLDRTPEEVIFDNGGLEDVGLCENGNFPPLISTGSCCGETFEVSPSSSCYPGDLPESFCSSGVGGRPLPSGQWRVGPLSQSIVFDHSAVISDISESGSSSDFSSCCQSGFACYSNAYRQVTACRAFVWAFVKRIA
jgi:hypothetical protein